jgi:FkbM family methyltransferase
MLRPDPCALSKWFSLIPDLEWFSKRLADDESRELLVDVIAYRIMGPTGVRLPYGTKEYRQKRSEMDGLSDPADKIDIHFNGMFICRHNLSSVGYPISLYIRNPMTGFGVEQYSHHQGGIFAEKGDVVIDGGGCYGDTALYFAHKVGGTGSVHVFEFVLSNLEILRKNLDLNPSLKQRVTIVQEALWNNSGTPIYVRDNGPASKVSLCKQLGYDTATTTCSIDHYVASGHLSSVDFIKLDIEGAEEQALRGAEQTIRKMRPKMAVCLYHSPDDFVRLPRLLDEYCPNYKFYIKHATMHAEETVLFAKADD